MTKVEYGCAVERPSGFVSTATKRRLRKAATVLVISLAVMLVCSALIGIAKLMPRKVGYACRTFDYHPDVTPSMRKECAELDRAVVRGHKL